MGLNIKNESLVEKIRAGAAAEGLGQTAFVDRAVSEFLARSAEREAMRKERAHALVAALHRSLDHHPGPSREEMEQDMYGEDGLPR